MPRGGAALPGIAAGGGAMIGAASVLGLAALLQDLGYNVRGEVWGDASAALGIINRKGLGKTRHIETGLLWIQQTAADQRLKYHKVLGKENPADLYTKFYYNISMDLSDSGLTFIFNVGYDLRTALTLITGYN